MGIQRWQPDEGVLLHATRVGWFVSYTDYIAHTAALEKALVKAKETIRALHGETAWDIYDRCSPEMKIINAALDGQP